MLTRPGKVACEQSASDIFMPLRVSFDRKSGKVLTRDVLLPRTSIFFPNVLFFIWLFATNQRGKDGKFTPRDEPPRKLRNKWNSHFSCYLDLPHSIVFHSTGKVTKEPPLAIHLIDLSESKSRNQLTFRMLMTYTGEVNKLWKPIKYWKTDKKRQKSRGFLQSLSTKNVTKVPQVSLALSVLQKCVSVKRSNSNILSKAVALLTQRLGTIAATKAHSTKTTHTKLTKRENRILKAHPRKKH